MQKKNVSFQEFADHVQNDISQLRTIISQQQVVISFLLHCIGANDEKTANHLRGLMEISVSADTTPDEARWIFEQGLQMLKGSPPSKHAPHIRLVTDQTEE